MGEQRSVVARIGWPDHKLLHKTAEALAYPLRVLAGVQRLELHGARPMIIDRRAGRSGLAPNLTGNENAVGTHLELRYSCPGSNVYGLAPQRLPGCGPARAGQLVVSFR